MHVPALTQGEVPVIPDADDPWLDETANEDQLERENKKRRLPMPAGAVLENRAGESDFDRFDDLGQKTGQDDGARTTRSR